MALYLRKAEYKGDGNIDEKEYEIPFKPARVILQVNKIIKMKIFP